MYFFRIPTKLKMLVDLELKALENIVKDGVKEMMSQAGGRSRGAKKRPLFKSLKEVITGYQHKMQNEFLPVLVKDFGSSIEVKFSGGKLSEEDRNKIKEFLVMLEKANIQKVQEDLVRNLEALKEGESSDEVKEKVEEIKKAVVENHQWIIKRLEIHIRSVISDTIYMKTVQRSKIEVMLYNFVDGEVPESVKKLFANGMESVPNTKLTKKEVDKRVEEALLEFLLRLGRRRIYGYIVMQVSGVQDWIQKVKKINVDGEAREFIERFENCYPGLLSELELTYSDVNIETKEEMVKKLEREGCVLVMCDKNMGMSLFTLSTMRKAEESLMNQLGAVKIDNTKEEIIKLVKVEIKKFEKELDDDQVGYMNTSFGNRFERNEITFPFLKCQHKVHKMSEDEIRNKRLDVLKFRPVVDAKQWLTKGYAGLTMQMMREACSILVNRGGPVMNKIKPKNGWMFSVDIREYTAEDEFDIMLTADIEEAYTNITDTMIKKSIDKVCRHVGFEEWKIELMKKLVDLVLGQNYAETSEGLFKFKKVLPMGYKLSGEALDIVALAEEMDILNHLGREKSQSCRTRIGELRNFPEEFVDISVEKELSMGNGVKEFRRYVDDVHSQVSGTKEEVLNAVLALGYMYPESLVTSMKLNIWHSSFLDVFVWKDIFTGEVSTVMKRNGDVPVGHVRKGSSHPEKYKLQSLLGEMLRGRRIASDEQLIDLSDRCIALEFQSIGYSRWEVEDAMRDAKKKVEEKYSGQFVKINEDGLRRYFSYGGGLVWNKNYRYGEIVTSFIENIKPDGEPGLLLLPDLKIKRLAFTRKRYLERQHADKKKSKS